MQIHTFDTAADAAMAVAARIAGAMSFAPDLVLGLATGRTPIPVYAEMRRLYTNRAIDFSRVSTFNLDEFAGIDAAHPGSFRRFMDEHLFWHVNIDPARINFLNGASPDLSAECERYESAIARAGGISLQLLGIGANGHIGFNEPGETLVASTHRVTLAETTRRDNAALFGNDPANVPRAALSMGVGTILKASTLVLVAMGERKAQCIERTVNGPVTTRLPASLLQLHRRAELYLDRAAARLL